MKPGSLVSVFFPTPEKNTGFLEVLTLVSVQFCGKKYLIRGFSEVKKLKSARSGSHH